MRPIFEPTFVNDIKALGKTDQINSLSLKCEVKIIIRPSLPFRVPCPFCSRTFTRNNTVRRHVAREHRALLGGVGVRFHPQLGGGEGAPPGFGSPPTGSATSSPSQGSPSTSTSASSSSGTNIGLSGMGNTSGGNMISGGGPLGPLGMNIAGPPHSSSGLPAQTPPPGSSNRPNSGSSGGMGSGKSME